MLGCLKVAESVVGQRCKTNRLSLQSLIGATQRAFMPALHWRLGLLLVREVDATSGGILQMQSETRLATPQSSTQLILTPANVLFAPSLLPLFHSTVRHSARLTLKSHSQAKWQPQI